MSSFTIHEKLLDFKTFFVCVDIFLAAAIRLARTAPFCAGRRGIRKKSALPDEIRKFSAEDLAPFILKFDKNGQFRIRSVQFCRILSTKSGKNSLKKLEFFVGMC